LNQFPAVNSGSLLPSPNLVDIPLIPTPIEKHDRHCILSAPAEPKAEPKPEGSPGEPKFLPPILRARLTPEAEEEPERLRKLAAKYGTDPTAIVGRVQASSQYATCLME
jgi:hypothetical protein